MQVGSLVRELRSICLRAKKKKEKKEIKHKTEAIL